MDNNVQQQIDDLKRTLDNFLSEYYRNNNATSQIFAKKCYFPGGVDISQGTINLGSSGSTIGLYGVTPVVKAGAISAPATPSGTYSSSEAQTAVNAINSIRVALANVGIIAP